LPAPINENADEEDPDAPKVIVSEFTLLSPSDSIIVRPYTDDSDQDSFLLDEYTPGFVIMYDPDVAFVRRLEIYKARANTANPDVLPVYFMVYDSSVQEQVYLSKLRREKEAFELLIREKGIMAIALDADGRVDPDAEDAFWDKFEKNADAKRRGGGKSVIVDVREFRSGLPFALFDYKLDIG
jgi:DNA excision repair protein ERCC-4